MNNLQKLYQTIFKAGLIDNSFDDFSEAILNESYQKKVFQAVTNRGLFDQDFNTFKSAYAPKQEQEFEGSGWDSFKNSLSNAFEMSGDVLEFWGGTLDGKTSEEVLEDNNVGAFSGLSIVTTLAWEKVLGRERMKELKKENPNFFATFNTSDSDAFQKMIQAFQTEKKEQKRTMTFAEADSIGDYLGVISGAIANVGGSVAYNLGTVGTGFFMEFAADNVITANEAKAESKGLTLDELAKSGQLDTDAAFKIAAVQAGLEYVGFSRITKPLKGTGAVKKLNKAVGKFLGEKYAKSKSVRIGLDIIGTGRTEAFTEMGQTGLEIYNKELAESKAKGEDINDLLSITKGMFSPEGIEAGLQGFFGGGGLKGGGYSAKALNTIRQTDQTLDVEQELSELTKLNQAFNAATDDDVKSSLQDQIAKVEKKLKAKVKKGNDKYALLTDDEISNIENLTDLANTTATRASTLVEKLKNKEITKEEFDLSINALNETYKQAKNDIKEILFQKDLKFAKEEGARIGKEVKVVRSKEEFQQKYNELRAEDDFDGDVTDRDGFILGDEIYINETTAREEGAISVGSHELLHGIIQKSFSSLSPKQRRKLSKGFYNSLNSEQKSYIEERLRDSYGEEINDKFFESEKAEELFTLFSDGIALEKISFNETLFQKIGLSVEQFFQNYIPGYKKTFGNGRQAYQFLREYNENRKAGKLGEAAVKLATEGEATTTTTTKASITRISEQAKEIQRKADDIGKKAKNKAEYDAGINVEAYDFYVGKDGKQGALDTLIKAKLARPKKNKEGKVIFEGISNLDSPDANVSGVRLADYIESVKEKMIPEILGFNPDLETTDQGKFGLSGHVNFRLDKRMGDVLDSAKKTVTGRSLDAPIDDSGRTAADFVEGEADSRLARLEEENLGFLYVNSQNRSQESEQDKNELKSRYRHKLKNNDGSKLIGEPQVEGVREGVRNVLRRLKDSVTSDKFLLNFENMVKKTMKNIVQGAIGTKATYRQFVLNNFETIIDFSTVQDLVAMERLVGKGKLKDGKKIFTVPIRRLTKKEDIQKAIDQGKLPPDAINKSEEGVFLSEKRMPTRQELEAFFFGVNMQEVLGYELGASTLGTRKDGLSRMIVTELSQDAMMETMQEPDIMEELISANPDVAVQVMVNDVAVKINRAPGLKFSRSALTEQGKVGFDILVQEAKGLESSAFKAYVKKTPKKIVNEVIEAFKKRVWEVFIQSDKLITQAELDAIDERFKTKKGKPIPLHRKYEVVVGDRLRSMLEDAGLSDAYIVEHPSETDNNQDVRVIDRATGKLALALEVKGDTARGVAVTLNYIDGKLVASKTKELEGKQIPIYGDEQQALQEGLNKLFNKIIKAAEAIKPGSVSETSQGNLSIEKEVIDQIKLDGLHLEAHDIKEEITFEQVVDPYRNKKGAKKATKDTVKISHAIELKGRGLVDISMDGDADGNFEATLKIEGLTKAKDIDVKVPLQGRLKFRSTKKGYTVSAIIEPQLAAYHLPDQKASFLVKDRNKNVKIKASKSKKLSVAQNITKASDQARTKAYFSKTKGASIFDFDETVGISENVIIATKDGVTKKILSDQWPFVGEDLANQGYEFDFTDFNKVTKGKPGPLLPKMKNQIKKYGSDNVFILTARAPESAEAIHAWLKSEGVNIPLENITGLGNSTGEAKAMWVLDKYANEGYNDMYFVDDAITNVQAVQNVFDQLDIKGKSVQAKIKFSKTKKQNFDSILKRNLGVDQDVDPARAKIIGAKKGKREFFIAPGADDFQGLMMRLAGQGKQGESDMKFFKQVFFDPFNRAYRKLNSIQYNMMEGYNKVRKKHKSVIKGLKKNFDKEFTNEDAIRIYLWDLQDIEVPGLTTKERKAIAAKVAQNAEMVSFALDIRETLQLSGEYVAPKETWSVGSIKGDMYEALNSIHRNKALQEWQENVDELLDNTEMLAKLEAAMGTSYVEALKDMLYRMRTGKNRPSGPNAMANKAMNWLQGAVGAIMFFNSRSAVLQTISTVNFINHTDNNIFAFAKAIANVKQFAEDFKMLFNSPQLKVRRSGLQQDIQTADLADSLSRGGSAANALAYLLKIGFTPTQIADSFAIAFGGAAFYRNRVNSLMKQGMTQEQAESQAMIDFQDITEESQQSSRPDRISQQQAAPVGRLLLAFQNTPLQYNRIIKKAITDIANKRGDIKTHISRIAYYGAIQSLIFYSLQQALFAEDDPEEEEVPGSVKREYKAGIKDGTINKFEYPSVTFYYRDTKARQKQESLVNSMADSWLRGSGVKGAIVSTFKNVVRSFMKESKKGYKADYFNTFIEVLNVSPQIGSKSRKIKRATDTYKYNKEVMSEIGAFDIDNPVYPMTFSLIEGVTNAPVHRIYTKLDNLKEAFNEDNTAMQRTFVSLGWNQWQLGIDTYKDIREAKEKIKERKKAKKKQCRRILSSGKRCSIRTTNKSQLCYHHN
tara:strand:+ start:1038 stop:8378 length:7341 start_codon:yes stop_codon:yes gene_type:complete